MAMPPADLISNFIEGLKLANLTPKRMLLQTGAKQYGRSGVKSIEWKTD